MVADLMLFMVRILFVRYKGGNIMKEMIYKGSVENEQKVIDMLDEGTMANGFRAIPAAMVG